MRFDTNTIINYVQKWLEEENCNIDVFFQTSYGRNDKSSYELVILELRGGSLKALAEKYGINGKMILRWILPYRNEENIEIKDFRSGSTYSSGYIFRRDDFKKENKPLHMCPDLNKGEIKPAWYRDIELKWKRFAKAAKTKCNLEDFIRLEAGLNAIFTSGSARQLGRFTKNDDEDNPLLALETGRQVLIDWPTETLGRLRIPHASHKNKLCPFQTPESKRTGLQLNLVADKDEIFSIATGLIPYPYHTDGPRLMMGGKNMKQAEIGIDGAEAPIVPGYYEGIRSCEIGALRSHLKNKRFFPYLGTNALTVIMPYKGYTYEDGLVISESLAKKFRIKNSHYKISKTFDVVVSKIDLDNSGIKELDKIFDFTQNKKFIYGDFLPQPNIKFYSVDTPELAKKWHEIYDHHAAGLLKDIKVKHVIKKRSGSKNNKRYNIEFNISWCFSVDRPMCIGDKITGRNGNKGVITKILPDDEMPKIHFSDCIMPAELIISPCSILGRKNLGQIWEMTHSLLIKKGGKKLKNLIEEKNFDINNICLDGINDGVNQDKIKEITDRLEEFLCEIGCDESGTFDVSFDDKHVRAFAGWQYFCRLHHHAWKKLQARGTHAPYDELTGQPSRCGALTGQRMGEMENWALLSHGALSILESMRINQTGNYNKTRDLLQKILRSLGISMIESSSGLKIIPRVKDTLKQKSLRSTLNLGKETSAFNAVISNNISVLDAVISIRDKLVEKSNDNKRVKSVVKQLDEIIKAECFFNDDGSIHIEPEILNYAADVKSEIQETGSIIPIKKPQLKKLLEKFCISNNDNLNLERAEALIKYRDGLIEILSHKTGIPRLYMSGRRYNHSGRAVIVPEPSLNLDCVYLPAAMLIELLDGYDEIYTNSMPNEIKNLHKMRQIFNDSDNNKSEAEYIAKKFDDFLNNIYGDLWCFLIRQPSLHRHSVQAFKIRCWALPVIGLPPLVTPGFNADFDGDTMAVFLPPYEYAKDLSKFSILHNPGLVGNGKIAFANSLDLALGWWNMQEGEEREKLSSHVQKLLKNKSTDEIRGMLRELQIDVAKNSSGAATLTPIEFENLSQDKEYKFENGLKILINSGAKGSKDDVEKIVKSIGEIEIKKDEDSEKTEKKFIDGNFWRGLTDDELFLYSYPSRFSMAQKKLSVADAGYLSRLLAEKLFEYTVNKKDCGASEGIEIAYSSEYDRILIDDTIMPTLGNLIDDLERALWGRVLLNGDHCLNSEDIKSLLDELKAGKKIKIRSPIHCHEKGNGHVCAVCYGADVASKPYDKPVLVYENFAAGLTAAGAIGERGTQLAMKRFHNPSISATSPIKLIRSFLVSSENTQLSEIITQILVDHDEKIVSNTANKELPQSLIHFEVAAACVSSKENNKYLSDIAGEKISKFLIKKPDCDFSFTDDFTSIKSRLLWEGGKN